MAKLMSVNVGLPKDIPWNNRTVYTGAWKTTGHRAPDGSAAQYRRGRPR